MIYYKAIQDIPSFHLKIGDELRPGKKNHLTFEHENGLSMPIPLIENMVQNGLFEKVEDVEDAKDVVVGKDTAKAPKIPKIIQNKPQLSLEDELKQTITEFINNKTQGSNLIVNSPIGEYLQPFIDIQDSMKTGKDNGIYHLGSIKTSSEYDINIYIDPYIDWGQKDCKIYSGDFILDLSMYYELLKKDDNDNDND